jgi:hypothetical protein
MLARSLQHATSRRVDDSGDSARLGVECILTGHDSSLPDLSRRAANRQWCIADNRGDAELVQGVAARLVPAARRDLAVVTGVLTMQLVHPAHSIVHLLRSFGNG